jgi:hypothetical protein
MAVGDMLDDAFMALKQRDRRLKSTAQHGSK